MCDEGGKECMHTVWVAGVEAREAYNSSLTVLWCVVGPDPAGLADPLLEAGCGLEVWSYRNNPKPSHQLQHHGRLQRRREYDNKVTRTHTMAAWYRHNIVIKGLQIVEPWHDMVKDCPALFWSCTCFDSMLNPEVIHKLHVYCKYACTDL